MFIFSKCFLSPTNRAVFFRRWRCDVRRTLPRRRSSPGSPRSCCSAWGSAS